MPPCGGVPYSSASRKKPNRSFASSSLMPSGWKIRACSAGVVDSDAAAADLAAVQHEVVGLRAHGARDRSRACPTSSSSGDVNGWCIEYQRPSSSCYSSSGKSMTHRNSNSSGLSEVLLLRDRQAQLAEQLRRVVGRPRRPSAAGRPSPRRRASSAGRERRLAQRLHGAERRLARPHPDEPGERPAAWPDRPARRAGCASTCCRPGTTKPRTTPPSATICLKTRNSDVAEHVRQVVRSRGRSAGRACRTRTSRSPRRTASGGTAIVISRPISLKISLHQRLDHRRRRSRAARTTSRRRPA